jgi:hypothetical protein
VKAAVLGFIAVIGLARADIAPVTVNVPSPKAWTGQRLPFYVELRARGSFAGSSTFDLPQLSGTVLLKIGSPVVGSEEADGETWFVQTHEFALFSQKTGTLDVPAFPVRFSSREGFTGPVSDVQAQSPAFTIEIQRPPASESIGFLITTESLDLSETWEPTPGPAEVGAVFKRTIVQSASQVPGMALAPAPAVAPDGIRVYFGNATLNDRLERGDFLGERRETITYLMQKPGTLELPALTYVWWNPKSETLESKSLPAVTLKITAPPATRDNVSASGAKRFWPWFAATTLLLGLAISRRTSLARFARKCLLYLNPPSRVTARALLRACRQHNAAAASKAWAAWRRTQATDFRPSPRLQGAVLDSQRHLFGSSTAVSWKGDELADAFRESQALARASRPAPLDTELPPLNPAAPE